MSDGLSSFVGVNAASCSHEAILHGTGKQSAQHPRFLAEFQYRFNRRFDLATLMPRLLRACAQHLPAPERLIRLPVVAESAAYSG